MGQSYHMRTDGNAALSRVLAPASLGGVQTPSERVGSHARAVITIELQNYFEQAPAVKGLYS